MKGSPEWIPLWGIGVVPKKNTLEREDSKRQAPPFQILAIVAGVPSRSKNQPLCYKGPQTVACHYELCRELSEGAAKGWRRF